MSMIIGIIFGVFGIWLMYMAMPEQLPGGYQTPIDWPAVMMGGAATCGGAILIYTTVLL